MRGRVGSTRMAISRPPIPAAPDGGNIGIRGMPYYWQFIVQVKIDSGACKVDKKHEGSVDQKSED